MDRHDPLLTAVGLFRGLATVRHAPDLDALRRAPDPWALADAALIPAARNLGLAIRLLPLADRREATAAVLACRVLDAFEDLAGPAGRRRAGLLAAAGYLTGQVRRPPAIFPAVASRDSEHVDLVLAERIVDVRALLVALPRTRRLRVAAMLTDIADAMARNLQQPMDRATYGAQVLGRAVRYACELAAPSLAGRADLCDPVGRLLQTCNDMRDGESGPAAIVALPPLALAAIAFAHAVGPAAASRGARAAAAYMAMTIAAFLCRRVAITTPYPRPAQLPVAFVAGRGPRAYAAVVRRVAASTDQAIMAAVAADHRERAGLSLFSHASSTAATTLQPIPTTIRLLGELPTAALAGEPDPADALRLMLADQFMLHAVDQAGRAGADATHELAAVVQRAAVEGVTR